MEAVVARPRSTRKIGPTLRLQDVAAKLGFSLQWVQDLVNVPTDHPDALIAYYNNGGAWVPKPPEKVVRPLFFYESDVQAWLDNHPPRAVEPIQYMPEEQAVVLEAVHGWYQDEYGNEQPILENGLVKRKALIRYLDKYHKWRSGDYPKMVQILEDNGFHSARAKKPDRRHVYRKGLKKHEPSRIS